jgi:hypothetical protein
MYVWVFQMVSFLQVFLQKLCMLFCFVTIVLHASPISSIHNPNHLEIRTNSINWAQLSELLLKDGDRIQSLKHCAFK